MVIDHFKPVNEVKNTRVLQVTKYSQRNILDTQQNHTNLPRENYVLTCYGLFQRPILRYKTNAL